MSRGDWSGASAGRLLAGAVLVAPLIAAPGVPGPAAHAHEPAAIPATAATATDPSEPRPAYGAGALAARIDSMSPAIPQEGDTVQLSGTVTNTSGSAVTSVSVRLRVSPTPLYSRSEIAEVLAGAGQRTGEPVAGSTDPVAETLAPGQTVPFSVSGRIDDLSLPQAGAYMVGAEALGDAGAGAGPVRQDLDRTFLPWWPEDTTFEHLQVTTFWPLVSAPVQDAAGALPTEDAALELTPAGRLGSLLKAAVSEPGVVSVVVDPQAVLAAGDLADGYEVGSGDEAVEGSYADEVSDWLEALQAGLAEPATDASLGLYALPDLVAARRGGQLGALLDQGKTVESAATQLLGRSLPGPVALPPGGALDARTLTALADDDVPAVLLADTAMPLAESTYFTPSGSVAATTDEGAVPVLLADSGLANALAMPLDDDAHLTAARQRLLAETLTIVTELPESQRLVVAAPDPQWAPSEQAATMVVRTLASAAWIEPTPLPEALEREPSTLARLGPLYSSADREQEVPADRVEQVAAQVSGLRSYAELLADPTQLPLVARTAPARGLSGWFRGDPDAGQQLADRVSAQVAAAQASVRVVSSGTITVSGETGTIPVTVENQGALPVVVGLQLTSDPPQLFQADPIDPVQIPAHKRTSVEITARVAAAGKVPVTIQLTTAAGEPFGTPGELVVQTSAYASAARILVRVALVALVIALIVHGVRRARRMRAATAPSDEQSQTEVVRG